MKALQYPALTGLGLLAVGCAVAGGPVEPTPGGDALDITDQAVRYEQRLDALIFEQELAGEAGGIRPEAAGQLDGAPVLGYVFPTTLSPTAVGFGDVDGILALAATAHPDFDDTPLFDEDGDYDETGVPGTHTGSFWARMSGSRTAISRGAEMARV